MFCIVKIWVDTGESFSTSVNRNVSDKEILNYYLGNEIDMGRFPEERMERVVAVRIVRA